MGADSANDIDLPKSRPRGGIFANPVFAVGHLCGIPKFRYLAVESLNHNHRPCRWFAQAPLGHVLGGAYRLVERSANRADFSGLPLKGLIYLPSFTGLPVNGSIYSDMLI